MDFTGSLFNRNRRFRKRAPPKLGAKHKKNNHMPLVGRDRKREKISNIVSGSAPYNPILSSSVQEEGKNILDPTLFKKNRSTDTPVGCRYSSAGRARAFSFSLPVLFGQTRRTSPVDGTHGEVEESRRISQPWASGRAANSQRIKSLLPNVSDRSEQ
ncbi:hypothetical protein J6590_036379 [Homalodisca vitripennis]|nr:hypothetical protein J6590_036379 [Homalodisca vitripennis]